MGGNSSKPKAELDALAKIKVGGIEYPTYNDEAFSKLREFYGVSNAFDETFSFLVKGKGGNMSEGGGKGGNLMGFTADRKFIVKELNKTDHNTLLLVAGEYADHMVHDHGSLLCKIVAHFYHPEMKSHYMIMDNVMPQITTRRGVLTTLDKGVEREVDQKLQRRDSYDLKGCADDKILESRGERIEEVHKRIWHLHMWCGKCCWNDQRKTYFEGKKQAYRQQFHVTKAQKDDVTQWLSIAVHFLAERSLMDYSLIVSCLQLEVDDPHTATVVELIEKERAETKHGAGINPFPLVSVIDGQVQILHVGIIDYLQDWTCVKNIAMAIKVCERNKATVPPAEYGARFIRHFTDNFVDDAVAYGEGDGVVIVPPQAI